MNIYILDAAFQTIDIIDDFTSLIWNTNFYILGSFELHVSDKYFASIVEGRYVYRTDSKYTGRIDYYAVESGLVSVKGNFLEKLLDFRYVNLEQTYSGNVETVMHNYVKDFCIDNTPIPYLRLGVNENRGVEVTSAEFGKSLLTIFTGLMETNNISYNIAYSRDTHDLAFQTFTGLDRTQEQSVNEFCVFRQSFDNIVNEMYETNTDWKNFAYVFGDGEGSNRKLVVIDQTSGDERRELLVDAQDIRREDLMW